MAKVTYAVRIPWGEAVALVGEDRLKRGNSSTRVANWRRLGVPSNSFLPLVLEGVRKAGTDVQTFQRAVREMQSLTAMPDDVLEMILKVRTLYDATHGEGPKWDTFTSILRTLIPEDP